MPELLRVVTLFRVSLCLLEERNVLTVIDVRAVQAAVFV